ncbi:MAG: glycosyltransferase family 4 protein [Phycisphaerae bacterium]
MSESELNVLHVIGGDTLPARIERLRALYEQPQLCRQRVVQFGSGYIDCTGLGTPERLTAPFGIGRLARRKVRSVIGPAGCSVVHIWSAKALSWVILAATSARRTDAASGRARCRLLMDVELPLDFPRLASEATRLSPETALQFVCPTDTVRRRLVAVGVPMDACVQIRDSVDLAAINAVRPSDVRSRLGCSPEHTVVLLLPPLRRETGALTAAWATMLLGQVRPGVRLVVPDAGREVDRVARLVESCKQRWMLRLVARQFALHELAAAADLAVYLPAGDATLSGVVWAMAAGCPIVASAIPTTNELLADGRNAWLCRAGDPKDAARRMLQALENPCRSQRQSESARSQVLHVFSRPRMVAQYHRAYENLVADRRVADGVEEATPLR